MNRSGDRTATSSTCTAVDDLESGEENLRILGRRSRLPSAGVYRHAWERLERFGPGRRGRWRVAARPKRIVGTLPGTRFDVLYRQPKIPVCGRRGPQGTAT